MGLGRVGLQGLLVDPDEERGEKTRQSQPQAAEHPAQDVAGGHAAACFTDNWRKVWRRGRPNSAQRGRQFSFKGVWVGGHRPQPSFLQGGEAVCLEQPSPGMTARRGEKSQPADTTCRCPFPNEERGIGELPASTAYFAAEDGFRPQTSLPAAGPSTCCQARLRQTWLKSALMHCKKFRKAYAGKPFAAYPLLK